jgi:hypothetical protein
MRRVVPARVYPLERRALQTFGHLHQAIHAEKLASVIERSC